MQTNSATTIKSPLKTKMALKVSTIIEAKARRVMRTIIYNASTAKNSDTDTKNVQIDVASTTF